MKAIGLILIYFGQSLLAKEVENKYCDGDSLHLKQNRSESTEEQSYAYMLGSSFLLRGGFALVWLGSGVGLFYNLWSWIIFLIRREVLLSIEVTNRDDCYVW